MSDLKPIIIINAGRSGSQFIVRMLQECNNSIEINHEFNLLKFKPELVKYNFYKNQQSKIKLLNKFNEYYIKKIINKDHWIDSSYVLTDTLLIKTLAENFPELRIIHLVRHGELVVSSWYNKLNEEIYEEKAINKLISGLEKKTLFPPIEKKYYWNIESNKGITEKSFIKLSQFEKICLHWKKSILTGIEAYKLVKKGNYIQIRLEDLVSKENVKNQLTGFIFEGCKLVNKKVNMKPHNINMKKQFFLTDDQLQSFSKICSKELNLLGYKPGSHKKIIY